jgi:hypothetical protein
MENVNRPEPTAGATAPQPSPFIEANNMNFVKAVNIMIQAANAAQRAGALAVRDSVLVASAGEFLMAMRDTETQ